MPVVAPGPLLVEGTTAILNSGVVVTDHSRLHMEFKVFEDSATPDEEIVVFRTLRSRAGPNESSIFDLPQSRVAVPPRKITAVEKIGKILLGKSEEEREKEQEEEQGQRFHESSAGGFG